MIDICHVACYIFQIGLSYVALFIIPCGIIHLAVFYYEIEYIYS